MNARLQLTTALAAAAWLASPAAQADAVTDWNSKLCDLVVEARLTTPPGNRAMAMTHTAIYEAVNAITRRFPAGDIKLDAAPGASVDAAVAAAGRTMLLRLLPTQQAAIDRHYQAALAALPEGDAKSAGVAAGEKAAAAVLAARSADNPAALAESYRPHTSAGAYVPTAAVAVPTWPRRLPWLLASASQFRPGPPPALTSPVWARDFNEIKALGAKNGSRRSAEQTEIAAHWEGTLPPIYHSLLRTVAETPGRDVTRNARLFAAAAQAADDALIAVFEAKYHYNFWRPVTAIRNGDIDGNDATERDASWLPFIETPMHPEYPCAHCTVAGALGAVLEAEIGSGTVPPFTSTSYLIKGATRRWTKVSEFVQEVSNARIYDGVHYRFSNEAGTTLGRQVGGLAAARFRITP